MRRYLPALVIFPLLAACGGHGQSKDLDPRGVETQITSGLTAQLGAVGGAVSCPTMPATKGAIYDCTLTDGAATRLVRVTVDDGAGHFHWELEQG